jgi:recombination protein RecR
MAAPSSIDALIEAFKRLPGVGERSASRMAYHLMERDREGAQLLSQALIKAYDSVQHCTRCHSLSEEEVCHTCQDMSRDASRLCVVETPADQSAVEKTAAYKGYYFVLMGTLSPLAGIGPKEVGVQALIDRACDGVVSEVILATNFNAEGETTAFVLSEALKKRGLTVTRLARGVPVGSELEYVDIGTIAHAMVDRRSA